MVPSHQGQLYTLRSKANNIRESPFSVAVTAPAKKLGPPILTICGVKEPWGVAITLKEGGGGETISLGEVWRPSGLVWGSRGF